MVNSARLVRFHTSADALGLSGAKWNVFCGPGCALLFGYRYAAPPRGADARAGANTLATTAFPAGETGPSRAPSPPQI